MKKYLAGLVILSSVLSTGCTTRVADLTVASSKNFNINSEEFITGERVKGEHDTYIISFIPTGVPDVKEAVDRAIENDSCAVGLSDMAMYRTIFYLPLVFGVDKLKAEGNLIIDRSSPGCENWPLPSSNT